MRIARSIFCGSENSWYTSTISTRSIDDGREPRIVDRALDERDVPNVLAREPRGEHLQHLGLEIVRVDAALRADARGKANGKVARSGADIGDRQIRQRPERVERLVGFLFGCALRSFEPFRTLPPHDVGKAPSGNRMDAGRGDSLREEEAAAARKRTRTKHLELPHVRGVYLDTCRARPYIKVTLNAAPSA